MNDLINSKVKERIISSDASMIAALQQMDQIQKKLLFVVKDGLFQGLLSIGDIQRAILENLSMETSVYKILRTDNIIGKTSDSFNKIKELMLENRIECMPVLDNDNVLQDAYFWEDIFSEKQKSSNEIGLPVVIMAGGKGTRLKPLTNVIPKPLIPINETTVIETIMDNFNQVGCNCFLLTVNYKADILKYHLDSQNILSNKISYFNENKPLGTAGSLYLLKDEIKTTFFVSNCDIIIDEDYNEILKYHRKNNNELTIVSALKHLSIPYGTIKTKKNGILTSIEEKPELTFQINTGFYILEPHLLQEIPENTFFHITKLIENINNRKGKVGVFPISEKSWIDIGEWSEYLKIIKK